VIEQNFSRNSTVNCAAGNDGLYLQCPCCAEDLGLLGMDSHAGDGHYDCSNCRYAMRLEEGIWRALTPERLAYFSRFITEYQQIRASEGRGSREPEFYLNLPYRDISGKNDWQWRIRARTYDFLSRNLLPRLLRNAKRPVRILDLGAGNGWMSYRLASVGYSPVAVDLLVNEEDGLGAAKHFGRHLSSPFPRFQAEMSHLPFADRQFDAAIFNASFHYAENYEAVLLEALRCTKEGGAVILADTPWYSKDESGQTMVAERRAGFQQRYGTASDSVPSLEYLTDQRLSRLEKITGSRWERFQPHYGLQWSMRPLLAWLRRRREPSRFRVYSMRKVA
jgi:SAM-dependent methyltransferase